MLTALSREAKLITETGCFNFRWQITDCLNVGEEVASAVQMLGIHLLPDQRRWYGEPGRESRRAFSGKLEESSGCFE